MPPTAPQTTLTASPLFELLARVDYLQVFLILGGVAMVWWFIKQSYSPTSRISMQDIVLDAEGKVSLTKIAQFGAFAISTWGFVHLVVYNGLTEWYYTSYMVAWAGTQLATYWISRTQGHQQGPQP